MVKIKANATIISVFSVKKELSHKQKKLATIAKCVYFNMFIYIFNKSMKKKVNKRFLYCLIIATFT
jgi:hypothetical protein